MSVKDFVTGDGVDASGNRAWLEGLKRLQQFRIAFGHSDVPTKWDGDPRLAKWVLNVRARPDHLSLDQLRQLHGSHFDFKSDRHWMSRFIELLEFRREHGHCNVPAHSAKNPGLGSWLSSQRLRQSSLSKVRRRLLDQAGMDWAPLESHWERMFQELAEFRAGHGHCRVTEPQNHKLALWVANVRARRKVTPLQKRRLDKLGFDWNVEQTVWAKRLAELKAFAKRFGHTNVPARWRENKSLGSWLADLHSGRLQIPANIKKRLDAVGLDWRPWRSQQWEQRFQELASFKQTRGHCLVPIVHPENPALGLWVSTQRTRLKVMAPDRIARLSKLGFVWKTIDMSARLQWEDRFQELLSFRKAYGHVDVPQKWPENQPLAHWVVRQRSRDRIKLTDAQLKQLNQAGFIWSLRNRHWRQRLAELKDFKDRFGHCDVPGHWEESQPLATWVFKLREKKRTGKLPMERIREVTLLGFRWEYLDETEKQRRAQSARISARGSACN